MKVLATTDGSEFSYAALRRLGELVPAQGTEVLLLGVYPSPAPGALGLMGPPYVDYASLAEQMRRETEQFLDEAQKLLVAGGFQVRPKMIEGDPANAILNLAEQESVDLIVVGSHGRTGLSRFLLGSVSSRVVSHAACSVLVIKASNPPG